MARNHTDIAIIKNYVASAKRHFVYNVSIESFCSTFYTQPWAYSYVLPGGGGGGDNKIVIYLH